MAYDNGRLSKLSKAIINLPKGSVIIRIPKGISTVTDDMIIIAEAQSKNLKHGKKER